jgi:hypothetical protein
MTEMLLKTLLLIVAWCLLFVLCWPLALAAIIVWPLLWLLSIPFRIFGVIIDALIAFVKAVLLLPARILGGGPTAGRSH